MSVLRRAKLRTPDGTESIEYPLGVDAENVEVANRENLSQRLIRIDEDLEKNEEDIAAVSELVGINKQNIGANEIRIDALERRSASVDKKPYYFNTVADMKAYQGLKEGDMAITLGYYSINDGGAAEYKIVNGIYTDNGGSYHQLNNNLYAKLIIKNNIIIDKQFGNNNILLLFQYCVSNNYQLELYNDYNIEEINNEIEIPSLKGHDNTITYNGIGLIANNQIIEKITFINNAISNRKGYCLKINNGIVKNCVFKNYVSPCIVYGTDSNIIKNNTFLNCAQGIYAHNAKCVNISEILFLNTEAERTTWISTLSKITGIDGILLENCDHVQIANSEFNYCTERLLYSSDSDNVNINNIIANYTNGIKFVGYSQIRHHFNANNIVLHNSFDDAFCQLYMCEDINITNCYAKGDDEPYYIGWFIRAGRHVANVNITGNKATLIRRSFLTYQDYFADTVESNDYVFKNINITNNYADRMSLIANLHYPAIDIQDPTNEYTHTIEDINISNNIFYGQNYDTKMTYSNGTKTLSTLVHCLNGNNFIILNNEVKGININNYTIPCVELTNVTNVKMKMDIYENGVEIKNFPFVKINGNAEIIQHCNNTAATSLEQNGLIRWHIVNDIVQGVFNISYKNRSIWLQFPKNFNILGQTFNIDEINTFAVNGSDNSLYVTGTKISTTLGNTQDYIYFYKDGSSSLTTLRTRSNRTLTFSGTLSGLIVNN